MCDRTKTRSQLIYKTMTLFPAAFDLSSLDGRNGFTIRGADEFDRSGIAVSNAGDINNDGIDDLIIGAYWADGNGNYNSGKSHVVFGRDRGFDSTFDLSNLDGSNGFTIDGIELEDKLGRSVSNAGDVNGDGIDDLLVGAYTAAAEGRTTAGESYVIFGSSSGFSEVLDLADLDGNNGFVLNGIKSGDYLGASVSGAGDVNSDGIDDFVVGAVYADSDNKSGSGESYVVFGNDSFDSTFDLSGLDGNNGFIIGGVNSGDELGVSVSYAGDINNDGIDDLIVGAQFSDPNGVRSAGESYVIFGSDGGFSRSFDLSSLDGSNGFSIHGTDANNYVGSSVSNAGDVNNDGIDDIILGAFGSMSRTGKSYVVFGSEAPFSSSFSLGELDGSSGFSLEGTGSYSDTGRSVSRAGDVNGDGIDDVIVGAPDADSDSIDRAGESYVVFGSAEGFDTNIVLSELDGVDGFILKGIDSSGRSGQSVSGAGDINGDGIKDIVVGAPYAKQSGHNAGESYVVFGRPQPITGTTDNDKLYGQRSSDTISGGRGRDRLYGKAGRDVLSGGNGHDILEGGEGDDTLNGNSGRDVLKGGTGNDLLRGQAGDDWLEGIGADSVGLGSGEVDVLVGGAGTDIFVLGNEDSIYYSGGRSNDFAKVMDFDAAEDIIQLKGMASDYTLQTFGRGTRIISEDGMASDLVAILKGVALADFSTGFSFV